MEIDFSKNTLECLQRAAWEIRQTEQTQEVKVPDAMPDIGTVLGAWGQPVIRGKSWQGNGMTVNGGIMTWVLYAPEDGSMPRVVETWLPYQLHWDFPQTQRDGSMIVRTLVQNLDARSVSPRKLMVRAGISAIGEALEPVKLEVFLPQELPEDVCVLKQSYPVTLLKEAGEKAVELEEELSLPQSCADAQKILYYSLQPEITDRKIMGDKVVFRGSVCIRGLCRCADNRLQSFRLDTSFSQYGELERQYDEGAQVQLWPEVSGAELDLTEQGGLRLKAGIVGQYVILDRQVLEVVEDTYSPGRNVEPKWDRLELPVILEQRTDRIRVEETVQADAASVLDLCLYMEQPRQTRMEDTVQLQLSGSFQLLYLDDRGQVRSNVSGWESDMNCPAAPQTCLLPGLRPEGIPLGEPASGQAQLQADIMLDTTAVTTQSLSVITGLELGEPVAPDPDRPSLILRKVGRDSLWTIAKECGSTVEAISLANNLEQEPEADSILLIPVS